MFTPRVALASLSGEADATWAENGASDAGAAFIGGISLDTVTRDAARQLVDRGRCEFLPSDPIAFITTELDALADVAITPGVNVRSTTPEPVRVAGRHCAKYNAILEINAHCRQDEMCMVGAGETLLQDNESQLRELIKAGRAGGAMVSVKVRAGIDGVDLTAIARTIADAGGEIIHVDAMDTEVSIKQIATAAPELFIIANNGVRGHESVREYYGYGADAVSIGRPSTNRHVRRQVRCAAEDIFETSNTDMQRSHIQQ